MTAFLSTPQAFLSLVGVFVFAAFLCLFFVSKEKKTRNAPLANFSAHIIPSFGALFGIIFSGNLLLSGQEIFFTLPTSLPLLSISILIDSLSAFFIFLISLITLAASIFGVGYIRHLGEKYSIGTFGFFYNIFIASLLLVVTANHAIFFLIAWEIMSVSSYFLVTYEHANPENIRAGFLYFLMTQAGTEFIVFAFVLLYGATGSFDFDTIRATNIALPEVIKNLALASALFGLAIKAGVIPLHIWLPKAHPVAPSHVSALLSGVMLKVAIFMMIRFLFDLLAPAGVAWGIIILVLGAVSAVLGVLYALAEHDLKRLLAYHSVENIGIILLGLGSAVMLAALGHPALASIALAAALYHSVNHALFKGLLFLGAGSVASATGTRDMEKYGGLIKTLPATAFFFIVGSFAISGLPPLNGFASEWLTFQALLSGVTVASTGSKIVFVFGTAALALTAGLAAACFVKVIGITFLARPRSDAARDAKEHSFSMKAGMGILTFLCVAFGVFSAPILSILLRITNVFTSSAGEQRFLPMGLETSGQTGAISLSFIALLFIAWTLLTYLGVWFIAGRRKEKIYSTWDCGAPVASPRTEISATGFSRTLLVIFGGVLRPVKHEESKYSSEHSPKYFPTSRHISFHITDIWTKYLYDPYGVAMEWLAVQSKKIQNGNVHTYILYIFLTIIVLLVSSL
jgi:hydrogenase-4 component B